jgi:hypothetical protein
MQGSARRVALGLFLALAGVGCNSEDRPDTATWLSQWDAMVSVVPDQVALGDPPNAGLCETTLASLRAGNEDLLPGPTVTVDGLVTEWVAIAEAAFFDCPPQGEEIDSFPAAYEEMSRIEASVSTALSDNEDRP